MVVVDAPPVADAGSFGNMDAIAPPPVDESGPGALTLTIGDTPVKLTWGYADYKSEGLTVTLIAHKVTCAERPIADRRVGEVTFRLQPGPEGKHYAKHALGVELFAARDTYSIQVFPDQSVLKLEDFRPLVEGEHLRGSLEAETHTPEISVKATGTFDVEVCTKPAAPVRALRANAPTAPVAGVFDKSKLVPKTTHAIVRTRFASHDEAVAGKGTRPYLARLVFYDKPDVPCPKGKDDRAKGSIIVFGDFGAVQKMPTPAQATIVKNNDYAGVSLDAWIQFDNLAYEPGEHIKGSLWAQSAFEWDAKGELGGTFDAIVCVP